LGWEEKEKEIAMYRTMWRGRGWSAAKTLAAAGVPSVWPKMRQVILYALADFPEARASVAAAIREFVTEDEK
jgi:hypothetical protein